MNVMLLGRMGSGKTYYSNILVSKGFKRISLAEPIKAMEAGLDKAEGAMELAELVYPHFKYVREYGDIQLSAMIHVLRHVKTIPREEPKPRKRLQYIGTEGGRTKIDPSIWIKILKGRVKQEDSTNWVIDDCRFVNEYEQLKDLFIPIKVTIDYETQVARLTRDYPGFDLDSLNHASELDIDKMNPEFEISGTLTLEEATRQLEEMLHV